MSELFSIALKATYQRAPPFRLPHPLPALGTHSPHLSHVNVVCLTERLHSCSKIFNVCIDCLLWHPSQLTVCLTWVVCFSSSGSLCSSISFTFTHHQCRGQRSPSIAHTLRQLEKGACHMALRLRQGMPRLTSQRE